MSNQNLINVNTAPAGYVLQVKQIRVGPMANFVYLLFDKESAEALVVDSGWETQPIEAAAKELGATIKYVVASHEHFDHVASIPELASSVGARVVAHEYSPVQSDLSVGDGYELRLGSRSVKVLHAPGHTEDSICLYDGSHVFTGDMLFVGTIGRFERERAEPMFTSLHEVILSLPPSTMMYPGHDYGEVPSRTLGEEASMNPYLMVKDFRSFRSLFLRE